ncbi:MAG: dTMP kinase [Phycisphaerales bacterium]|nr:dTMP kinase [Phycisphaerales bacterium]
MQDAQTHAWTRGLAGRFLVFEGPDGSGKTTQLRRFVECCKGHGVPMLEVREPGGTLIGERIRDVLLDRSTGELSMRCEMLLYMASRAQLVEEKIMPALAEGKLVIADRFVSSTLAYQGAAGGLPIAEIEDVARCALRGVNPDLVIIFDVDEITASKRMNPLLHAGTAGNGGSTRERAELDRIEARGLEFHRLVRGGYLAQAKADPDHHLVLDASKTPEEIWEQLQHGLTGRLCSR